jgi:hypothetical protein
VLPTPFLAPWEVAPRRPRHPEARAVAEDLVVCATAAEGRLAVFLETTPRQGLAVAISLLRCGWHVAPLYGRWPPPVARSGVLPTAPLAGWLVWLAQSYKPRRPGAQRAEGTAGELPLCLLLDQERHRPASQRVLRRRFDNRYDYAGHMLPPAARLLRLGVRRVRWLGKAASIQEDLELYAASLVAAGIALDLAALPAETR